jgi:hypothetical protein
MGTSLKARLSALSSDGPCEHDRANVMTALRPCPVKPRPPLRPQSSISVTRRASPYRCAQTRIAAHLPSRPRTPWHYCIIYKFTALCLRQPFSSYGPRLVVELPQASSRAHISSDRNSTQKASEAERHIHQREYKRPCNFFVKRHSLCKKREDRY